MKIEDQVCSLELAKRLKELGVKQESFFYYKENHEFLAFVGVGTVKDSYDKYSAFTVAELGEMLPRILTWPDGSYALQQDFYTSGDYNIYYYANNYSALDFTDRKEVNARAKMLIYLIENNLWKPEE